MGFTAEEPETEEEEKSWVRVEVSWIGGREDWALSRMKLAYQRASRRRLERREQPESEGAMPTGSTWGRRERGLDRVFDGIGMERRERWTQRWFCMRRSLPDGGAAHGGCRLRFWVEREMSSEERRREEEEEWAWVWLWPGPLNKLWIYGWDQPSRFQLLRFKSRKTFSEK